MGCRLDSIPLDYWDWCLEQKWFHEHDDLYEYAKNVATPRLSCAEMLRMLRRM